MSYRLRYVAPAANRAMTRFPEKVTAAIAEFIHASLLDTPYRGKPLSNELQGYHSARRGDYRIIYTIDDEEKAVDIVRIGHRSHVYG